MIADSARIAGAVADNAVGTSSIVNGAIRGVDVGDTTIDGRTIKDGAITRNKLAANAAVRSLGGGYTGDIAVQGYNSISANVYRDTLNISFYLPYNGVASSSIPMFTLTNTYASSGEPVFVVNSPSPNAAAVRIEKGVGTVTATDAAMQFENYTAAGEGLWLRNASATNAAPVIKLHQHPSSTANFEEGYTWSGTGNATRKYHISSAGTFVAGSDFAEAFSTEGSAADYSPGDVLVLAGNRVAGKTSTPYDTRVAGVYSSRPGVLGADKNGETRVDSGEIPLAITGIVPTRVTNENGAINPGDLLTTSRLPGFAMKATPRMIGGEPIYPAGTILGKALESFDAARGTIDVLIMLR
jgi:hypothetical protein